MWQAALSTPDDIEIFGLKVPFYNATLLEFLPLEFGAWQGVSSFFPMKYLGTKMSDGQPVDQCMVGFDLASFVLGMCADTVNFCKSYQPNLRLYCLIWY
jgi:lysophospholipase